MPGTEEQLAADLILSAMELGQAAEEALRNIVERNHDLFFQLGRARISSTARAVHPTAHSLYLDENSGVLFPSALISDTGEVLARFVMNPEPGSLGDALTNLTTELETDRVQEAGPRKRRLPLV